MSYAKRCARARLRCSSFLMRSTGPSSVSMISVGWLGEKRRPGRRGLLGCCEQARGVYAAVAGTADKRCVIRAAALVGAFSLSLGALQLLMPQSLSLLVTMYNVLGGAMLSAGLYCILRRCRHRLKRPTPCHPATACL